MKLYARYMNGGGGGVKPSIPNTPQECDYFFTSKEDFQNRIEQICTEHNNDLSEVTLGFDDSVIDLSGTRFGSYMGTVENGKPLFPKTLTDTPKMIFARNVKKMNYLFSEGKMGGCYLKNISSILFKNCPNVEEFKGTFYFTNITSIPSELFKNNQKAITFYECFAGNMELSTIPEGLFNGLINVENIEDCFGTSSSGTNLEKLLHVPENLFDDLTKLSNVNLCFYSCKSLTSAIPDAWNKDKFPKVTEHSLYAHECTQASNYDEIPYDWK